MKKTIFLVAAVAALACTALAGCASGAAPPTADQVSKIETACAIDAGVRPTVSALLAIPGLASADEIRAVNLARAAIDPICANPSAPLQASAMAAFTNAAGQIVGIVAQLQARKAAAPPG